MLKFIFFTIFCQNVYFNFRNLNSLSHVKYCFYFYQFKIHEVFEKQFDYLFFPSPTHRRMYIFKTFLKVFLQIQISKSVRRLVSCVLFLMMWLEHNTFSQMWSNTIRDTCYFNLSRSISYSCNYQNLRCSSTDTDILKISYFNTLWLIWMKFTSMYFPCNASP